MKKRTENPSDAVKMRVMKRDRFSCTYCGAQGKDAELEIDHIIPVSKGGSHHMSNLTTACRACNQKKGAGALEPHLLRRNEFENYPLIHRPVHILKDDGEILNQGMIIGIIDGNCLIQRFSFLDGRPTDIITLPLADVFNQEKCKIYANFEEFHREYFREMQRKGLLRGTIEENVMFAMREDKL